MRHTLGTVRTVLSSSKCTVLYFQKHCRLISLVAEAHHGSMQPQAAFQLHPQSHPQSQIASLGYKENTQNLLVTWR